MWGITSAHNSQTQTKHGRWLLKESGCELHSVLLQRLLTESRCLQSQPLQQLRV